MYFIYTLVVSGLLIFAEFPAEQPPPYAPYYDVETIVAQADTQVSSDRVSSQEQVTSPSGYSAMNQPGELYYHSPPVTYLGITNNTIPIQATVESLDARQPALVQEKRGQEDAEAMLDKVDATPTLLPKSTTLPTVAVAKSPEPTPTPPVAPDNYTANVLATYQQQSPLPASGYAMFYNPNVMQVVMNNRLAMGHISTCAECVGNVALLRAGDLNRRVWLQWGDGTVEGPFLVADVAASHHVSQLLARNWVVDVDHRTAVRRGMAGPVWVTVWSSPPSGHAASAPPFAPLYPETPVAMPVANTPVATMNNVVGGFPTETPVPTVTPLPAIQTTVPEGTTVPRGFPTETPIPTVTPLPALQVYPTVAVPAPPTEVPTNTPLPTPLPTLEPIATRVDDPVVLSPTPERVVTQGGFPTDTPVPTNTALPALIATATLPATPIPTVTLTPTSPPTPTITMTPTATVEVTPTRSIVTQGGFPTDTPVPTITPLPAINQSPTPSTN